MILHVLLSVPIFIKDMYRQTSAVVQIFFLGNPIRETDFRKYMNCLRGRLGPFDRRVTSVTTQERKTEIMDVEDPSG